MATTFKDVDQYFDPGLILPVRGVEYRVPLASAEIGLWCRRLAPASAKLTQASTDEEAQQAVDEINALPVPPELEGKTLPEVLLGETYAAMVADKVPDPYIQYCGVTALMYVLGGEELAERWWTSGGRPEAQGPGNRASRRAAAKTGGSRTAGATGTRSPASTSGTKSRTTSGRATRARQTGQ